MNVRQPEQVLNEQETRVVHLRDEQKWTFRQIAGELGITRERARQCLSRAREKLADVAQHGDEALCLLPSRAARIVRDYELNSRAEVRRAIETGRIFWSYWAESFCIDGKRTRNAGWQCWEHFHEWARLPPPVHDRSKAAPQALKRPWGELPLDEMDSEDLLEIDGGITFAELVERHLPPIWHEDEASNAAARRVRKAKSDGADAPKRVATTPIEDFIQRMRTDGVQFPVNRWDVYRKYRLNDKTIRELARRGMLELSEAWDGSLTRSMCLVLEGLHITGRKNFRERYLAGEFDLSKWRNFGKLKQAKLLAWAGLRVPGDGKWEAKLNLLMETWKDMDELVKKRGLRSRDELVTRLVAEGLAE